MRKNFKIFKRRRNFRRKTNEFDSAESGDIEIAKHLYSRQF